MKIHMKIITFIVPFFLLILITGTGCTPKDANNTNDQNPKSNGTPKKASTTESIAYLPNGEVDTSDWKTYHNDHYDMEIKYPPFLDNVNSNNPNSKKIWIRSQLNQKGSLQDKNWNLQFGATLPTFHGLSLKEKRERFINKDTRNSTFEVIELDNGFIFYQHSKSKAGYVPGAQIFSKNKIFAGTILIYSDDLNFEEYDPKYIDTFKAMLKSIEFKN